jgi:hypothetical protein
MENLRDNLKEYGVNLDELPLVMQYNKRDLPNIYSVEELNQELNHRNLPFFEAVAIEGSGVHETLKAISKEVLRHLAQKFAGGEAAAQKPKAAAPAAPAPPAAEEPKPAPPAPPEPPPAPAAAPETTLPPIEMPQEIEQPAVPVAREQVEAPAATVAAPDVPAADDELTLDLPSGTEELPPIETPAEPPEEEVSIGGGLDDDSFAEFYGGGTSLEDAGASASTEAASSEGDSFEEFMGSGGFDIPEEDTAAEEIQELPSEDVDQWMGGGDDSGIEFEVPDEKAEESPAQTGPTVEVPAEEEELVLQMEEETAPEPEPTAPEPAPAPAAAAPGPVIEAPGPIEIPIPLELVGGFGELTRSIRVPVEFVSPQGKQVVEIEIHFTLRPKQG